MAVLTSTRQKRDAWIEWLDHCRGGRFVNQRFFGKTIGGVPDVWAPAIVALEMALRAGSYTPRSAWAYNFRGIAGATCTCSNFGRCSLHGGQGAIDIDPRLNPFIRTSTFRWSDTAFTPEQIALIEGMLNTKGEQLWFWGGRWNSIKDYMHWEPNVDPGSTDVDWTTVPGETEGDNDMPFLPLKDGDGLDRGRPERREDVYLLQSLLGFTGSDLDGFYGGDTATAVKPLTNPTGDGKVVGGRTYAAIEQAALGGGGAPVDVYTKVESDGRFARKHGHPYAPAKHPHNAEITETTKVVVK